MCGPVCAEILAGTLVGQRRALTTMLIATPWIEVDHLAWLDVGVVSADLRRYGMSTPLTDVTIDVAAARAGAALWTLDRDFTRIQQVLPALRLHHPL